ncbi:cob(I)yrinic acid a,c-diamide adenosyltransferase [Dehalogenimonas formicexedens]|uniref:cob(I)yrinic acid a,c-diamide adenosyltransferase n=1 Tax=Dehalogenimonas formicexedens TaxID=1839801 RepID=UPI001CEF7F00|nr:cob(I)yrinic acid a,c-diamide adenosyltransferase [Dehalogenimonas formicexedens]
MTHTEEHADAFRLEKGLVSVFTGHGKGKTSAAIGIAVRGAGWGARVFMLGMMKGGDYAGEHGEYFILKNLPNVTVRYVGDRSWLRASPSKSAYRAAAKEELAAAKNAMVSGDYDIVIIDEINQATAKGLVDVADVLDLINNRPEHVELILTGRDAAPEVVQAADLVSEILMIKHPFTEGIRARKGIDY